MSTEDRKVRADARANRDRILEVARAMFTADPQTSLNAVVKAAGVGAGTFYRHFPSREALVLGLYRSNIDALVTLAPALLAVHSPLEAFWLWCDRLTDYGRVKHGVADTLRALMSDQDSQDSYQAMASAVRLLIESCERDGTIRSGNDPEDVLVVLAALWRIPPTPAGALQANRLLKLLFRGLGAEPGDGPAPQVRATGSPAERD